MNNAIELQVLVAWKIITDICYVFNSQELWHLTSAKARGNSEFLVKFLGQIFQFLYAAKSSCDLSIYSFSDIKHCKIFWATIQTCMNLVLVEMNGSPS